MATKKKEVTAPGKASEKVAVFKGSQLMRMDKYNNRIARIVLDPEKKYSFAEADEMINEYLKKKG